MTDMQTNRKQMLLVGDDNNRREECIPIPCQQSTCPGVVSLRVCCPRGIVAVNLLPFLQRHHHVHYQNNL